MSKEEFIAQKDGWRLVTIDPTDEPTPPPMAGNWPETLDRWGIFCYYRI